jgi:hypothetical protein
MTHCLVNRHIAGQLVLVLVPTEGVMLCCAIEIPPAAKFGLLSHFFVPNAGMVRKFIVNDMSVGFYGQNAISKEHVRQWNEMFKMFDRTNVYEEGRSCRPSICSEL